MARRHVALVAGVALLGATAPALAGGSRLSLGGAAPAALVVVGPRSFPGAGAPGAGVARLARVPGDRAVALEVALRPSHPAAIATLLRGLYDPASPSYHRFLPAGAFLHRFRPAPAAVARLRAYLHRHRLTARFHGFSVAVSGPASAVEAAFHVRLAATGRGTGAATPFRLPHGLATAVQGVVGASVRANVVPHLVEVPIRTVPAVASPAARPPAPRPWSGTGPGAVVGRAHAVTAAAAPSACTTAAQIASLNHAVTLDELAGRYGIAPLLAAGADGRGVTVAVYELAAHSPADVAALLSCEGVDPSITTVPVDGGGALQPGGGTTEADLDLEQLATQAPGATILSYEGPATAAGQYDVWAAIIGQDRASVVSTSWGICEAEAGGAVAGEATLFQQAAAQGQTIVAASGDVGSEDCFPSGPAGAAVDFPASDPYVTAVGGTTIAGAADVVWNTCGAAGSTSCATSGGHASGGGVSSLFAEPSWQQAVLPSPPAGGCPATACRGVPDVVANAGTTEVIYDGGGWAGAGGTSAASPLVAGLAADLADTCGGRLGDLAPALYAAAATGTGVTDVTSGTNDLTGATGPDYAAGPGYDLASGLGTPLGAGLACPSVASVTPASAPPGAQVTLTGTDLAGATIDFGATPAQVVQAGAGSATVVVPAEPGPVTVDATGPLGAGVGRVAFTVTAAAPAPGAPAATAGAAVLRPSAGQVGPPPAPSSLRAAVEGRRLALGWRDPSGPLRGFLLTVRACPVGHPCRLRHYVLAPRRTRAALRVAPGRYAVALVSLGAQGTSRPVRRWVRVAPPPAPRAVPGRSAAHRGR